MLRRTCEFGADAAYATAVAHATPTGMAMSITIVAWLMAPPQKIQRLASFARRELGSALATGSRLCVAESDAQAELRPQDGRAAVKASGLSLLGPASSGRTVP